MKKKISKSLRELASKLPPVMEWVPYSETKKGSEINAVMMEQFESKVKAAEDQLAAKLESRPLHEVVLDKWHDHLADLGVITPDQDPYLNIPEPKYLEDENFYKRKSYIVKAVNHYKNLKKVWSASGQEGITAYSQWAVAAYKEQTKNITPNESNSPQETSGSN